MAGFDDHMGLGGPRLDVVYRVQPSPPTQRILDVHKGWRSRSMGSRTVGPAPLGRCKRHERCPRRPRQQRRLRRPRVALSPDETLLAVGTDSLVVLPDAKSLQQVRVLETGIRSVKKIALARTGRTSLRRPKMVVPTTSVSGKSRSTPLQSQRRVWRALLPRVL